MEVRLRARRHTTCSIFFMLFASFPHNASDGRPPLRGKGSPSSTSSFPPRHPSRLVSFFQGTGWLKKTAAQNPPWGRAPEVWLDWLGMDVLIPSPWPVSSFLNIYILSFLLAPTGTDPWGRPLPGGSSRRRRTSPPCPHASDSSRWVRCGRRGVTNAGGLRRRKQAGGGWDE